MSMDESGDADAANQLNAPPVAAAAIAELAVSSVRLRLTAGNASNSTYSVLSSLDFLILMFT